MDTDKLIAGLLMDNYQRISHEELEVPVTVDPDNYYMSIALIRTMYSLIYLTINEQLKEDTK